MVWHSMFGMTGLKNEDDFVTHFRWLPFRADNEGEVEASSGAEQHCKPKHVQIS